MRRSWTPHTEKGEPSVEPAKDYNSRSLARSLSLSLDLLLSKNFLFSVRVFGFVRTFDASLDSDVDEMYTIWQPVLQASLDRGEEQLGPQGSFTRQTRNTSTTPDVIVRYDS